SRSRHDLCLLSTFDSSAWCFQYLITRSFSLLDGGMIFCNIICWRNTVNKNV
ncbi:unnamed protein product, partial [Tenebrio molitor]